VGLGLDDGVWDATVFRKNRDRLLEADVSAKLLNGVVEHKKVRRLLSRDHYSVDGTLIEAWASMKSFHGKESRLCFMGHALMENRNGLVVGGDQVLLLETRRDGQGPGLGAGGEGPATGFAIQTGTGDQHGLPGGLKERRDAPHLAVVGRRPGHRHGGNGRTIGLLVQHVLGQRHDHRPRGARQGHVKGPGHDLAQGGGPFHLPHPFRQVGEGLVVIDLLKGAAPQVPARHLGVGHRHEAGAVLVAASHDVDGGTIVQRVEDREIALAGHAEDAVDRVVNQGLD
jgi:hypothetical protein